ncbi:hypothetical protein [Luteolibacter luteus]|uniref:Uncharacterized protein n=1 Tax=Luteolibacter luteus TaxID=2728835 RepID=A0A858RI76_9BACT|nr:hypothetical protein [Luteolibacter luteus]QJE96129.1 hypothetical protein HHL09_10140 [Luteolibacter luteus]
MAVWISLVALLVIKMKGSGGDTTTPAPGYAEKNEQPKPEDIELLNAKLNGCAQHFQEFVSASDLASRALHIINPDKTVPRMVRYYAANSAIPFAGEIRNRYHHVIHTPAGTAIETGWNLNNEQQLDVVFFEDGDDWKMDWDAFVRFSSEPWALFLSAQGPTEGVFRVLARERIGAAGRDEEYIGLVVGAPRLGHPEEVVSPSPEIRVKRASEIGRRIEEAFRAREQGRGAFGSIAVQDDPGEMIRLRVRMARVEGEERSYKITELLATHWMEIEEPVVKAE